MRKQHFFTQIILSTFFFVSCNSVVHNAVAAEDAFETPESRSDFGDSFPWDALHMYLASQTPDDFEDYQAQHQRLFNLQLTCKSNNALFKPVHETIDTAYIQKLSRLTLQSKKEKALIDNFLHKAVEKGRLDIVRAFIEYKNPPRYMASNNYQYKPTVNSRLKLMKPLLCQATRQGHLDSVQYFVNQKVPVHHLDPEEGTPLHIAAKYGHFDIVKLLIQKNADAQALNCDEQTPFEIAQTHGHTDIADYLATQDM